jgi:hypothetical protein
MDNSGEVEKLLQQEVGKQGVKMAHENIEKNLNKGNEKAEKHLHGHQKKLEHVAKKYDFTFLSSVYFLLLLELIPVLGLLLVNYFLSLIVSLLVALGILIVALVYLVAYIIIYKFPNWVKSGALGFFFAIVLSFCEAFFVVYVANALGEEDLVINVVAVLMIDLFIVLILAKSMNKFNYLYAIIIGFVMVTGVHALYIFSSDSYSWVNVLLTYLLANFYQIFLFVITDEVIKDKDIENHEFTTAIFATLLVFKEKINFSVGILITITLAVIKCCKKQEQKDQAQV